ncbi:MAG TPA: hypothetical protein PLQ64_08570 [Thiobacillaceae bacterium]|nr:hypothetical protein [Thiobacillaceae bacterium]HNI07946.1 hypothetical protein [Thiobacillaceae bacterium]
MNTAGRLLAIHNKLTSKHRDDKAQLVAVWGDVFDLPSDAPNLDDEVVTCLQALRSEIDLLSSTLHSIGADTSLYNTGLSRLRGIASPSQIHAQWGGHRESISRSENQLTLGWAEWALRDESEEDMEQEDFEALKKELNSLEDSVLATNMSPYLRNFVKRQLDVIRSALKIYRIRGVRPIEEALQRVAGTITIERGRVEAEQVGASEETLSVLARAGVFIEKTAKVADQLDTIRKAGLGAYSLAASVGPALLTWAQGQFK